MYAYTCVCDQWTVTQLHIPFEGEVGMLNNLSIYIMQSCLFVCLFVVNAKTTARIDAKRSGITKNSPESVLRCLKLPVLVLSGRYSEISVFSFTTDRHFLLISLRLLAPAQTPTTRTTSLLIIPI